MNSISDRRVKLGLYGCGRRTRSLLDSLFMDEQYQVVAAYDRCRESTESACAKYGGLVCETDTQLIDHPEVEAFIISLDPFAHPPAFYRTLEAGKPIFIEKPIAMTADEAYRMMIAAEQKNIPVHVGLMRRYLAKHVAARKFMAETDPGRMLGVNCRWFHAGEREMINCLTNCPDNFRLKVSQIPYHCCHMLDVVMLYAGDVKSVAAVGVKVIKRRYPSPDEVVAHFEFNNGAVGCFEYSSVAYKGEMSYVIHTENYTLTIGDELTICRRPEFRSLREDGSPACHAFYNTNIAPEVRRFSTHAYMVDHKILFDFLESVRTGAPMKVTIRDGYRVAELAEAIELSWKESRKITLPLQFPVKSLSLPACG